MAVKTQKKQGTKSKARKAGKAKRGRELTAKELRLANFALDATNRAAAASRKAKRKTVKAKAKAAPAVERPPMPKRTTRTIQLADGGTLEITHQERANGTPDLDPTKLSAQDLAAISHGRAQASVDMAIRKMSGQD